MKPSTRIYLILFLIVMGLLSSLCGCSNRVIITSVDTDERGLTSVTFIENGREFGYDYLTKEEYINFLNGKEPYGQR